MTRRRKRTLAGLGVSAALAASALTVSLWPSHDLGPLRPVIRPAQLDGSYKLCGAQLTQRLGTADPCLRS